MFLSLALRIWPFGRLYACRPKSSSKIRQTDLLEIFILRARVLWRRIGFLRTRSRTAFTSFGICLVNHFSGDCQHHQFPPSLLSVLYVKCWLILLDFNAWKIYFPFLPVSYNAQTAIHFSYFVRTLLITKTFHDWMIKWLRSVQLGLHDVWYVFVVRHVRMCQKDSSNLIHTVCFDVSIYRSIDEPDVTNDISTQIRHIFHTHDARIMTHDASRIQTTHRVDLP